MGKTLEQEYRNLLKVISKNLKRLRKRAQLTQEQVSHLGGFHTRFYQKLESGTYSPNLFTLVRAARALKAKLADLLSTNHQKHT